MDALTAVLVVSGAPAALIGPFGVLRLGSFFQRVHAPTLGSTLGAWSLTLATVVQVSFERGQLYVHSLLIGVFLVGVLTQDVVRRQGPRATAPGRGPTCPPPSVSAPAPL